jgi:hypothetical protein
LGEDEVVLEALKKDVEIINADDAIGDDGEEGFELRVAPHYVRTVDHPL